MTFPFDYPTRRSTKEAVFDALETKYGPETARVARASMSDPTTMDPVGVALDEDIAIVPSNAHRIATRYVERQVE